MSGPPKDEFRPSNGERMGDRLVLGKIEIDPDGTRWLKPMVSEHAAQVHSYQAVVQALLEAAMEYSSEPSSETLAELKQAAHRLRAHSPS